MMETKENGIIKPLTRFEAWRLVPEGETREDAGPRRDASARSDPPKRPGPPKPGQPSPLWRPLLWVIPFFVLAYLWFGRDGGPEGDELAYTAFKQKVREGEVATVTFRDRTVTGTLRGAAPDEEGQPGEPESFTTTLPPVEDPELITTLEDGGVEIRAEAEDGSPWTYILISALPWILLFGLFFLISRRIGQRMARGGPAGGIFGFGKSKAKRFRRNGGDVALDEVAGLENAKRDVVEIIEYLRDPPRFRKLGARIPKGILLMGPPGTGKTLMARAVAGEAEVPFYSISGSEFIEMFVGVGASRVRDMFKSAKEAAPAVIFIDEIDSVGRTRGSGLGGGHDEREQTLNQILSEMDGFSPEQTVVVLAATNRPDVLDPALLRPGRFDRKIVLELPRKEARRKILEVHARRIPLADDVDLGDVAAKTVGFSGADLENLLNEAALLTGRKGEGTVGAAAIDRARDKIVMGAERERLLDGEEKERIAFHESGHALLASLLPNADPLTKVTIIPRGRALGATEQLPDDDRYNNSEGYLRDRITVMLGGRVAERIEFDEISSGAESDLRQATQLARRMVSRWGMSEKLGPVALQRGEEHIFLGREMARQRDFSEYTARLIDDEIRSLLTELEARAEEVLTDHHDDLRAVAAELLEEESLGTDEIQRLIRA